MPELIRELQEFSINIDAIDPYADPEEFEHEYGIKLKTKAAASYDAVVLAVNHEEYTTWDAAYFKKLMGNSGLLYDVKGILRGKITDLEYLSL